MREKSYDLLEQLVMYMGEKEVLDNLTQALDSDTLYDILEYIARMYDIPTNENEE